MSITLDELNNCDRRSFVAAVGWVFEHSPWVAERAWGQRPFRTVDDLHRAMTAQVDAADPDEQRALLRAHPDLGARAKMSRASTREQTGAGLDSLTSEEFDELRRLNTAYREKFGFPFLYAVKGSTKHDILTALSARLRASAGSELQEGLRQAYRIARLRLEETIL